MASSVLLGVAMLKLTAGLGFKARDVNDDMVMARGIACVPFSFDPGSDLEAAVRCVDVQTTTEFVRRRIMLRNWWDNGTATSTSADEAWRLVALLRVGGSDTFLDSAWKDEVWKHREEMSDNTKNGLEMSAYCCQLPSKKGHTPRECRRAVESATKFRGRSTEAEPEGFTPEPLRVNNSACSALKPRTRRPVISSVPLNGEYRRKEIEWP